MKYKILFVVALNIQLASAAAAPPNFVVFCSDDQSSDQFGFLNPDVLTPTMDRLRDQGLYFANHHTVSTVCSASRYAMLSGRFPNRDSRWQPIDNGHLYLMFGTNVGQGETSVITALNDIGYFTGLTGKADGYAGKEAPGYRELCRVAEASPSHTRQMAEAQQRIQESIRAETGADFAGGIFFGNIGPHGQPFNVHNQDYITAANLEFIDQAKTQDAPFFLWSATTIVHAPLPLESMEKTPQRRYTPSGYLDEPLRVQPDNASVFARLEAAGVDRKEAGLLWLDDAVTVLLDKLEKENLLDNTIFVYVSDHSGYGGKGTVYQKGVHVPLIIYWKGRTESLADVATNVSNADITPTLLDFAGVDLESYGADGRSLKPCFEGHALDEEPIYMEMGHTRAVRMGEWKYIAWRFEEDVLRRLPPGYEQDGYHTRIPGDFSTGMIQDSVRRQTAYHEADQLYYLPEDPGELHNLASDPSHAERLLAMQSVLARRLRTLRGSFGDFKYETEINGPDVVHPVSLSGDLDLRAPYNVIAIAATSCLTEPEYTLITYEGDRIGRFDDTSSVREFGYRVDYSRKGEVRIMKEKVQ